MSNLFEVVFLPLFNPVRIKKNDSIKKPTPTIKRDTKLIVLGSFLFITKLLVWLIIDKIKLQKKIHIIVILFCLIFGYLHYLYPTLFPKTIKNYIPDLLWSISLILSLIVSNSFNGNKLICVLMSLSLSYLYEIGQLFDVFSGTFDFFDLIIYSLGILIGLIFNDKILKYL